MKKLLVVALLLALPGWGAEPVRQGTTLMFAYDLDGEAADADQVVTAANGDLTDSKTFTITASPDVCRLVDMTVTDANSSITAGTITVVGTDCLDYAKTCSLDWSVVANRGSGVKSFTCTDGTSAYYKTVTSVTTTALTGEGGAGVDLCTIGYTANSANGWGMYGTLKGGTPNGYHAVDPFGFTTITLPITTSNVLSTTVTSVASNGAFTNVAVGDLLLIPLGGMRLERKVTARASADSITVSSAILIPTAGVTFSYKKLWWSTNPYDQLVIDVSGWQQAAFTWSVDANVNTGGVVELLECLPYPGPDWPTAAWISVDTNTVASAGTQAPTVKVVDVSATPYQYCRFGFKFGTGDDGDGAVEDINLDLVLVK